MSLSEGLLYDLNGGGTGANDTLVACCSVEFAAFATCYTAWQWTHGNVLVFIDLMEK